VLGKPSINRGKLASTMKKLLPILALLIAPYASAETVLYCQAEATGGVIYKDGRYRASDFEPNRYTLSLSEDRRTLTSKVSGYSFLTKLNCSLAADHINNQYLACDEFEGNDTILLSLDLRKATIVHLSAWTNVVRGKSVDTSAVSVATCEKF